MHEPKRTARHPRQRRRLLFPPLVASAALLALFIVSSLVAPRSFVAAADASGDNSGAGSSATATATKTASAGGGGGGDGDGGPFDKGAVELTSRNFDSSLRDGNVWMVEFYAPWCGHCKRFEQTYDVIASTLYAKHLGNKEKGGRRVMVGKVDGSEERGLMSRFNIRGFPTFYLVDGWTVWEYRGERSLEAMVEFATVTYKEEEPIPFVSSPYGPMGQARAVLMIAGVKMLDAHEALMERGISSTVAGCILALGGIVTSLFLIIWIGFLMVPKEKVD